MISIWPACIPSPASRDVWAGLGNSFQQTAPILFHSLLPSPGLGLSVPGTDNRHQSPGASQPYSSPGPKSHSYSGYMSQSEAKYEKLIR